MTKKRKKIVKRIGYTLLGIVALVIIATTIGIHKFNNSLFKDKPNYLEYASELKPIHFEWAGDSIGGHYEPQAAMIIPFKIDSFAHEFYMQFDTGSPYSYIYENELKSLRAIGLDLKIIVKDEAQYIEQLEFSAGENHIELTMIKILEDYGQPFSKNDTIGRIGIGTIGSDFLVDRITAIDFKNKNIQFFDVRPDWIASHSGFKPFDFSGRRIMLPVTLDNKDFEFLYDSGASAFSLITTKNRYDKYSNKSVSEIKYDAKSWESSMPIRSKPTDKIFNIGSANLKLKRVSYVDMYTKLQPLMTPFTRIGGWLGNQALNESTLILDTNTEEFIVITD